MWVAKLRVNVLFTRGGRGGWWQVAVRASGELESMPGQLPPSLLSAFLHRVLKEGSSDLFSFLSLDLYLFLIFSVVNLHSLFETMLRKVISYNQLIDFCINHSNFQSQPFVFPLLCFVCVSFPISNCFLNILIIQFVFTLCFYVCIL